MSYQNDTRRTPAISPHLIVLIVFSVAIVCCLLIMSDLIVGNKKSMAVPISSPLGESTSDWKVYTSKKDYYSFSYPQSFVATESASRIVQLKNQEGDVVVTIKIIDNIDDTVNYCILNALTPLCEHVTSQERQMYIDWRKPQYAQALISLSNRYGFAEANPQLIDKQLLKKILFSFKNLTDSEDSEAYWDPVCKKLNISDHEIVVSHGDSQTLVTRKAIRDYFNYVTLSDLNQKISPLNAQENIYAEDYIRREFRFPSLYEGESISIPCSLVEKATLKARNLTIQQKNNLEKYSQQVPSLKLQDDIRAILEE